jgi:serine/threonine protein kinase
MNVCKKMPPKKKHTKPLSSRLRKTQPKPRKRGRVPKLISRKTKETSFIPVPSVNREVCEQVYNTWNDYKEGKMLGKGRSGEVYELCDERKQCPYVLKVQDLAKTGPLSFRLEVEYQMKAKAFAPKIHDAWICHTNQTTISTGFIVMERMDGTLDDYIARPEVHEPHQTFSKQFIKTIRSHVAKLHKMGISHGDLHSGNIFHKNNKWFLGDFGSAGPFGGENDRDEINLRKLEESLSSLP